MLVFTFLNLHLPYRCIYTIRLKTNSSDNTDARWQKTPVANLVRHVQSGNYYARIWVRGKLIWKSLKTD